MNIYKIVFRSKQHPHDRKKYCLIGLCTTLVSLVLIGIGIGVGFGLKSGGNGLATQGENGAIHLYKDCYDVYEAGESLPGIYVLYKNSTRSFEVNYKVRAQCLEDGFTVIQSRGQFGNPKDYFLKIWDDYVKGFGEPGK